MELSYDQKRILANIKDQHRGLEEAKVILQTNRHYTAVVETVERHLNKYLERAAEAEIPAEMIKEATAYKPVSKLREEIAHLNAALDIQAEIAKDLRAEVTRVNRACAEIDADCDAHARRMERVAVAAGTITFILGIALGMMV